MGFSLAAAVGLTAAEVGTTAAVVAGVAGDALIGAGLGAAEAGITGGDPGMGALGGALTGCITGGLGAGLVDAGVDAGLSGAISGAAGGAIGAQVTGGNPLTGALGGGVAGGIAGESSGFGMNPSGSGAPAGSAAGAADTAGAASGGVGAAAISPGDTGSIPIATGDASTISGAAIGTGADASGGINTGGTTVDTGGTSLDLTGSAGTTPAGGQGQIVNGVWQPAGTGGVSQYTGPGPSQPGQVVDDVWRPAPVGGSPDTGSGMGQPGQIVNGVWQPAQTGGNVGTVSPGSTSIDMSGTSLQDQGFDAVAAQPSTGQAQVDFNNNAANALDGSGDATGGGGGGGSGGGNNNKKGSSGSDWLRAALPLASPLLSAGGVGAAVAQGNQPLPYQDQVLSAAQQTGQQGSDLINTLNTGKIPAGAQSAVQTATNSAKATVRSNYAAMGLSGSTMEAQALGNVDRQASQQTYSIINNLVQQGLSETQISQTLYSKLMGATLQQDQQLQSAISNFATSLGQAGSNMARQG